MRSKMQTALLTGRRYFQKNKITSCATKSKDEKIYKKLVDGGANIMSDELVQSIMIQEWDKIIRNIALNPDDARKVVVVNDQGNLCSRIPLHEACRYKAPLAVVKTLIYAYPEGVQCRDSMYQFLPIHFACRYGASADVVDYLLRIYPESREKQARFGSTPMSLAIHGTYQHKESVIRALTNVDFTTLSADDMSVLLEKEMKSIVALSSALVEKGQQMRIGTPRSPRAMFCPVRNVNRMTTI